MCEYLDYEVSTLKRSRIMNIKLDTKIGEHRELTKEEMDALRELLKDSNKSVS